MKNPVIRILPFLLFILILTSSSGQNVGINCPAPSGKLHIKGSADIPQFILDAHINQTNSNPLIKLRKSDGSDLMWIHSDDSTNIFIGFQSGRVTTGKNNTFLGKNTGYANTEGVDNTAMGAGALFSNTIGYGNIALGKSALYSNTSGDNNVAVGTLALFANTTGYVNTAIGRDVLRLNTTGAENTGIGFGSLKLNTQGGANVAVGLNALYENTTGSQNTALGYKAFYNNKAGSNATAIGYRAMYYANNTSSAYANYDVAVGYEALFGGLQNNTGNYNTAIGYATIHDNATGIHNVATGYFALHENFTGNYNTANGSEALTDNTTGSYNTGFGYHAVLNNITGSSNSGFGDRAYFTSSGLNNTTCIGSLAGGIVNASNRIEIGNTSVTWMGGQVSWSTYSDGRIKENVEANVPGLEFINRLRPVTYNLNIHQQNEMVYAGKKEVGEWPEKYDGEKIRVTGFIAQEVAQAAAETGYEFSGVDIPKNPVELYSIRYSDFVMPLVKAAQELSASIDAQNDVIDTLKGEVAYQKSENAKLMERIEKLEGLIPLTKD